MNQSIRNTMRPSTRTTTIMLAAALSALPAAAQLGLGRVTGSASAAVDSTTRATVSEPGLSGPGVLPAGRGGSGQDVFGSLGVAQNAALSSRIGPLVPATTTLPQAATGFQSDSEFIAALHAAHNLNVPFERMKAETTGKGSVSLEKAIKRLRPDLDSKAAKEHLTLAQRQSERDIQQAGTAGRKDHVSSRITSDDRLAAQLNPLVPSGQTLSQAAAGFSSEDQFMSTLHASHDNGIAFGELKDRVTAGQSLGTAIHGLKPDMDENASASAASKAEAQSKNDKMEASASAHAKASAR